MAERLTKSQNRDAKPDGQKPSSKATEPSRFLTRNQLADRFKRDRRTVTAILAEIRPDGKAGGRPLWDPAKVAPLLTAPPRSGSGELRAEKLAEEIRKLKIANDAKDRVLVPRSAVIESFQSIIPFALRHLEQKLVNEYPPSVVGLTVPEARVAGRQLYDEIKAEWLKLGERWKH